MLLENFSDARPGEASCGHWHPATDAACLRCATTSRSPAESPVTEFGQPLRALSRTDAFPAFFAELTETDIVVYQYAVRHGHVDRLNANHGLSVDSINIADACDKLLRLRLLSDESAIGLLTPVHPDTARMLLNEHLANEIKERERIIDLHNRQLRRIADALARPAVHSRDVEGIRVVAEPAEVQREVNAEVLRCTQELITTQLGAQVDTQQSGRSVAGKLAILRRGVGLRMLYQHIARTSLGIRSQVTQIARYGGVVRTTSESFDAMSIFDRRIAFVPFGSSGDRLPGAVVITHPAMVHFLYRSFERLWSSALPFEDKGAERNKASADNRILLMRLMASGLKDEAIAHRLGIATRTCRRHMSALMEELGAASRIQAGVKIAQLGILSLEHDVAPWQHRWVDAHPLSYLPVTCTPLRRRA
jgi:hypothetical protein